MKGTQMRREILLKYLLGSFTIKRLFFSVVFIYFSCALIGCAISNSMMFFPPARKYSLEPEMVMIETPGGEKICAYHFLNPDAEFTIIYSHGNAEDIAQNRPVFERFVERGFSVLAYDYRGYGLSEGRPTEKNTYEDIEAAYSFLTENAGVSPDKIIPYGRSIGGGPAVYLASRKQVAGVILQSAFTSAYRVMTHIPILPFDKYNNLARIKKINRPVLIMHGTEDTIVKPWHGRKLFETANEPKLKLWVENTGHNEDIAAKADKNYWKAIETFIDEVKKAEKD